MLQKVFFNVDSFNPEPYWTNPIVNLAGGQKFDNPTVFIPGVYLIDVQAGSCTMTYNGSGKSGRIQTEVEVTDPFIIRAYCGSRGTSTSAGNNPYVGAFKVNASNDHSSATPAVTHIFGNRGSTYRQAGGYMTGIWQFTSGNCLGNGILYSGNSLGAGSCLHLLPVGGTFGTDYLFAFHCTAGVAMQKVSGTNSTIGGGVGSAYGGAGSGAVHNSTGSGSPSAEITSFDGGSTPYGTGGAGAHLPQGSGLYLKGNNGTGAGYGYGGGVSPDGAGAWFNGTTWVDSRTTGGVGEDGHIIVKYIAPLQ